MNKQKLTLKDNTFTYLYSWKVENPKAVLNIIHGSKEHILRYKHMAEVLNKEGISVYGMDLRGHGQSSIEQASFGHIDSYEKVKDDIDVAMELIKEENPGVKTVIYGHSMGSFVARYYATFNKDLDYIFSGTNEQSFITSESAMIFAKIGRLFGKKRPNHLVDLMSYKMFDMKVGKGKSWLSSDPSVQERYNKDNMNPRKFTNESFEAMMHWLIEIHKKEAFEGYTGRILIASGDKDPVGSNGKGPKKVHDKFIKNNVRSELKIYKEAYHEIHNEYIKDQVFKDYAEFILREEN